MKRTPLKRGKPLKRSKSPLKKGAPLKRVTPLKPRSKTNSRPPAESAYMRWIRSLPCTVCAGAKGPSQAAHTNVLGRSGLSDKTNNRSVIPLCAEHHLHGNDAYHRVEPETRWAELHGLDLESLVVQLNERFEFSRRKKAA